MNGNVKIQFKDGQNWVGVDGIVNWSAFAETFKEERPVPSYVAPIMSVDTWNGKEHDVQHILHDSWYLEFWVKESELHKLAQIKSCDTVIIIDIENGLRHIVDMQTSDWFEYQQPEQVGLTTNYKIAFIYRTNKKTINKFNTREDQVTIIAGNTYTSKYEKIVFDSPLSQAQIAWDGSKVLEDTSKTGYKTLLYMSDSEKQQFIFDYKTQEITIDGTPVVEIGELEINPLGEDNYRIIATFIISVLNTDKIAGLSNVIDLLTGSTHYYSKFISFPYASQQTQDSIFWAGDEIKILSETFKTGQKVLLFLAKTEFNNFQDDWNQDNFTIDGITIIEKLPLEFTELESGNYQVIVSCITQIDTVNKTTALSNVVDLLTGSTHYYSKYSKLPYNGELEEIRVLWGEGGEKLLQETNNVGFRVLYYFTSVEFEAFKNDWNQDNFTIDGTNILRKLPLEKTETERGFFQVIVSCITVRDTVDKVTGLNNQTEIRIGSTFYNSKFEELFLNNTLDSVLFEWADGKIRSLRDRNKIGSKLLFYVNEATKETIKNAFNINNVVINPNVLLTADNGIITADSTLYTADNSAFLHPNEKIDLEISKLESGYYQIIMSVITQITETLYTKSPENTHELIITDSGTFTFYTDYPIVVNIEDTENSDFNNEQAIEVTAKSISRTRQDIKLFLNTSDKNSLKKHFERGTATIDSIDILQKDIVSVNELGFDIYEVNISALTETEVIYQL